MLMGMAAIGLVHLLDAPGKYSEIPLFVLDVSRPDRGVPAGSRAAAARPRAPGLGGGRDPEHQLLHRVRAQPHGGVAWGMQDIGNWTEPLGLASLYVEACVFVLGLYGLARFWRTR